MRDIIPLATVLWAEALFAIIVRTGQGAGYRKALLQGVVVIAAEALDLATMQCTQHFASDVFAGISLKVVVAARRVARFLRDIYAWRAIVHVALAKQNVVNTFLRGTKNVADMW